MPITLLLHNQLLPHFQAFLQEPDRQSFTVTEVRAARRPHVNKSVLCIDTEKSGNFLKLGFEWAKYERQLAGCSTSTTFFEEEPENEN